jgi:hypothetical protein
MLGKPKKFAKPHLLRSTLPILLIYILAQGSPLKLFQLFKKKLKGFG